MPAIARTLNGNSRWHHDGAVEYHLGRGSTMVETDVGASSDLRPIALERYHTAPARFSSSSSESRDLSAAKKSPFRGVASHHGCVICVPDVLQRSNCRQGLEELIRSSAVDPAGRAIRMGPPSIVHGHCFRALSPAATTRRSATASKPRLVPRSAHPWFLHHCARSLSSDNSQD